jgi:hypothetical protein
MDDAASAVEQRTPRPMRWPVRWRR